MKTISVLKELNEITASQWGMLTTAQAVRRGVSRMQLSRLVNTGQLERLGHGIYRDAGTPSDHLESLRAAWLSINPKLTAEERLRTQPNDAIASGRTASFLLGLGDLVPEPYQFTVPTRRQTQRKELVLRIKQLPPKSQTLREGLPVTTPEQTIADLIEERVDRSLVANVLADIESIDTIKTIELLSPLAERNGFKRGDGEAFYAELECLARRDIDSLAKAVSGTQLAEKIAEAYFRAIDPATLEAINDSMQMMAKSMVNVAAQKHLGEALWATPQNLVSAIIQLLSKDTVANITAPYAKLNPQISKQLVETASRIRKPSEPAQPVIAAETSKQESETP